MINVYLLLDLEVICLIDGYVICLEVSINQLPCQTVGVIITMVVIVVHGYNTQTIAGISIFFQVSIQYGVQRLIHARIYIIPSPCIIIWRTNTMERNAAVDNKQIIFVVIT